MDEVIAFFAQSILVDLDNDFTNLAAFCERIEQQYYLEFAQGA